MSINQRLSSFLEFKKFSQTDLANSLGVTRQVISQYLGEKPKNIGLNFVSKIIDKHSELNKSWLLTGEGEMLVSDTLSISKPNICFVNVPVFAGEGDLEVQEERTLGYLEGVKGKDFYGLEVKGNSMQPTLLEGDHILCVPVYDKKELNHDKIYIVAQKGLAPQVKRLSFNKNGAVYLQSDNALHPDIKLDCEDNEVRFYKVTHRISNINNL